MSQSAFETSPIVGAQSGTQGTGLLERPPRRIGRSSAEAEPRRGRTGGAARGPGDGGRGDGGQGGGGRNGGDGPAGPEGSPYRGFERPPGTRELGFWFLLTSIGTLFLVFLGAYVVLRKHAEPFFAPGSPAPPAGLWVSTLVILASSATLWGAARAAARARAARAWLVTTTLLGFVFLLAQVLVWRSVIRAGLSTRSDGYGAVFYSLTGLHALHVFGGLAFLVTLCGRARPARGPTFAEVGSDDAVALRLGSIYWHFLGAIWTVLFTVLYVLE